MQGPCGIAKLHGCLVRLRHNHGAADTPESQQPSKGRTGRHLVGGCGAGVIDPLSSEYNQVPATTEGLCGEKKTRSKYGTGETEPLSGTYI